MEEPSLQLPSRLTRPSAAPCAPTEPDRRPCDPHRDRTPTSPADVRPEKRKSGNRPYFSCASAAVWGEKRLNIVERASFSRRAPTMSSITSEELRPALAARFLRLLRQPIRNIGVGSLRVLAAVAEDNDADGPCPAPLRGPLRHRLAQFGRADRRFATFTRLCALSGFATTGCSRCIPGRDGMICLLFVPSVRPVADRVISRSCGMVLWPTSSLGQRSFFGRDAHPCGKS